MRRSASCCASFSLLALGLGACSAGPPEAAPPGPIRIVVFDVEFVDASASAPAYGVDNSPRARLALISAGLRDGLDADPRYEVVAVEPVRADVEAQIESWGRLRDCEGCEVALAREAGADQALIGWVQKVSEQLLQLNVVIRDAGSGEELRAAIVGIQGNSDATWRHAARYMVRNRLLQPAPAER